MEELDFCRQFLSEPDLDRNTDLCAQYLQCPLVVIAPSLAIVTYSHHVLLPDPTWQNAVRRGYITLEFGTTLHNWEQLADPGHPDRLTVSAISRFRRRFYRLRFAGRLVGYLNLSEWQTALDTIAEEKIDLVRACLARALSERRYVRTSQTPAQDILLSLLQGEIVDRLHYLESIADTDFAASRPRRCGVVDLQGRYSFNAGADTFREELQAVFPQCTTVIHEQRLVLVFSDQTDAVGQKKAAACLRRLHLIMGISNVFYDLYQIARYEQQAFFALQHSPETTPLRHYDHCELADLLRRMPAEVLPEFLCQPILEIHDQDRQNHTELLKTLAVWIRSGGSAKLAAAALHVHRNTVAYRMDLLNRKFHLNLDDPDLRETYLLSCHILEVLQESESLH